MYHLPLQRLFNHKIAFATIQVTALSPWRLRCAAVRPDEGTPS